MFCGERSTTQLLVQPFGVESDCNATVAVPLCAPVLVGLSPATRLVVLVEPGASRLIGPPFEVAAQLAESCASRLVCGAVVVTLVTLSACCWVVSIRTLPKLIEVGVMLVLAGLTTVPE